MKEHTSDFKNRIKTLGRKIKSTISINGVEYSEELFGITLISETSILKSVMKCLKFESTLDLEEGTNLNYYLGVYIQDIEDEETHEKTPAYEDINYGDFVIYEKNKKEDTGTFEYTCYDKMLYSMKSYEQFNTEYPIDIKTYLSRLCANIGLEFEDTEFYNQDKLINRELYLNFDEETEEPIDIGYTYRDVLDEIAAAVGGNIIINKNDKLQVSYINDTGEIIEGEVVNDTIDEEFIKDINVKFGEKFGPVNSIVLSRVEGADNIYKTDDASVELNGLCEIKIKDNQIMNFNNRDEFLDGLADALFGLEYYVCDYESTGVLYYDLLDRYNVKIGENTYTCIMFNDEIDIDLGIKEKIIANAIEQENTDYKKADKTDIRLNQTYIIADKQSQQIQSIVRQIGDRTGKETSITQDLENIVFSVQNSGGNNLIKNSVMFDHRSR